MVSVADTITIQIVSCPVATPIWGLEECKANSCPASCVRLYEGPEIPADPRRPNQIRIATFFSSPLTCALVQHPKHFRRSATEHPSHQTWIIPCADNIAPYRTFRFPLILCYKVRHIALCQRCNKHSDDHPISPRTLHTGQFELCCTKSTGQILVNLVEHRM